MTASTSSRIVVITTPSGKVSTIPYRNDANFKTIQCLAQRLGGSAEVRDADEVGK